MRYIDDKEIVYLDEKVHNIFKNLFPNSKFNLSRDFAQEGMVILKSKIELHLLSLLSRGKITDIFPYARENKEKIFVDIKNYKDRYARIAIKSFMVRKCDIREEIILSDIRNLITKKYKKIPRSKDAIEYFGELSEEKIFPVQRYIELDKPFIVKVTDEEFIRAKLSTVDSKLLEHAVPEDICYEYGDVIEICPDCQKIKTLFELYVDTSGVLEEYALEKMVKKFKESSFYLDEVKLDKRIKWRRVLYKSNNSNYIRGDNRLIFKDVFGREHFSVIINVDEYNGKYYMLPETLWSHVDFSVSGKYLYIPPEDFLSLINKENDFGIGEYATSDRKIIILTDFLPIVIGMNDPEFTWTSWYGGRDTIGRVDWNVLTGKLVYYVIARHSGFDIKYIFDTALKVYNKVKYLDKIVIRYVIVDDIPGSVNKEIKVVSDEDFLKMIGVKKEINLNKEDKSLTVESSYSLSNIQYLLYPAVPDNTTTLLHSRDPGSASWLTLSMAYAVAVGKEFVSVDKGKYPDNNIYGNACVNNKYIWMNSNPPKKVLYLYGESKMESEYFGNRLFKINKMFGSDNDHFFLHHMFKTPSINKSSSHVLHLIEQLLDSAKNDKHLEGIPVSLLVVDDYDMFGDQRHKESFWNELLAWMNTINKYGCSVLLMHPEKRHKAKAIKLQSVFEANAESHDDGSITFKIRLEQCRDQDERLRRLPDLEFNPLDSKPCWRRATLKFSSVEERDDKIVEMMKAKGKRGQPRNVKEIADMFGISRVRIHQIMKKMEPIK